MRCVPWMNALVLGVFGLGLAGCTNTPKKAKGGAGDLFASPPDPAVSPIARDMPDGAANGVLAGKVIDSFNQGRPEAVIQIVAADVAAGESPREVLVNEQGYFMIQGLQPGKRYKLSARAKRADSLLAGTAVATPPNAVLLIRISEEFVTPATPRMPSKPKWPDDARNLPDPVTTPAPDPPTRPDATKQSRGPDQLPQYLHEPDRGPNDRLPPLTVTPPPNRSPAGPPAPGGPPDRPPPAPKVPPRPENVAHDEDPMARTPPKAYIPPPLAAAPAPSSTLGTPLAGSIAGVRPGGSLQVPACIVTGNRVEDLALNDLNGRPFQLSQRRSKLVLLDFWGTWCPPCVRSLPYLGYLQRRYAGQGLEVIGIAYEDGTFAERAQKVSVTRARQGVTYRMLVGEGDDCPVRTRLGVQNFPTAILIDENGTILWRGEGLTAENKTQLESAIHTHLSSR